MMEEDMKKDAYYPAVFGYDPSENEISVVFPDLGCATSGKNDADALASARELLDCVLSGMKEDGEKIPKPSKLADIKTNETEKIVLINY